MPETKAARFETVSKLYPQGLLRRQRLAAVRDISLELEAGEVFGLIGPNRAGKTTLVKMLLALARPTSGRVERLGRPADDRRSLARVGYVHENQAFPRYLSARALLEFYGALTLLPETTVRRRAGELLERVGLADRAHEPIARFSKGMVQRLALAQALLNEPELLILDEPAEGLDLEGRRLVLEVIDERRKQGNTVLLVSHALADVARVCDRVGVLVAGQLNYLGPVSGLLPGRPADATAALEQAVRQLYTKSCA